MTEKTIKISEAKGRPMLRWVGKKPLDHIKSFPAQLIEVFDPMGKNNLIENPTFESLKDNWQNLLFHGDNKEVLGYLLANGFRRNIDFVFIDPPFDSGANYVRQVKLRGFKNNANLEGEDGSIHEQIQYFDIWSNDNYLQFIYERLQLLKELLSDNGFIAVHMNSARSHYIKILMDEIFVPENFRNEIIVKRIRKSYTEEKGIKSLNEGCDYILLYSKSPDSKLKPPLRYAPKEERWHGFDAPNIRPNLTYELFGKWPPAGRCWMMEEPKAKEMIKSGDLRPNPSSGWPEYRLEATEYIVRDTLWDDITAYAFTTDYPTEKKEQMLELLIEMCSEKGSIVLDCFMGSGTTMSVAQKLGRRWIGVDINKGSIQTTGKRLQEIIKEQAKDDKKNGKQKTLGRGGNKFCLSFTCYKVNDYDLQLLRTEAIELAVQHIGIQRTKTDNFFEGMLGKNLVKMIDFNHPLTLLDLQLIQDELKKRPDENRNITIVCLGKELVIDPWIEDYNKKHPVNKLEIIELRTDSKYGKFLIHKPIEADVNITRKGNKAIIEITNFISPSIIERLNDSEKLVKVKIPDFRSMIDVVLLDSNYDGKVFNIVYSDVPTEKNDLVEGKYKIEIPKEKTTVAVKIIDMLGEEMLITKEV